MGVAIKTFNRWSAICGLAFFPIGIIIVKLMILISNEIRNRDGNCTCMDYIQFAIRGIKTGKLD